MPDAIASYAVNGQTFYIIANEGDDRDDFIAPDETIRLGNAGYDLDDTIFPNEAALKDNASLGRLTVSNSIGLRGDTDGDGDIDQILMYGARSFSILNADGDIVFDSGDAIERIVAAGITGGTFDDTRSDNKGPEPEGVSVMTIKGRTYAFVGLERSNATLIFDVTVPTHVTYAGVAAFSGDLSPEGILTLPAAASPNGNPLLVVSNEVSNTVTIYELDAPFTLQLLHIADAEAGLLASTTAPNLAALVDAFDGTFPNTLILAGGDNYIPGPFAAAGTDASVAATHSRGNNPFAADIEIHNRLGIEASTIGNHEFDFGTTAFSDAINDTTFPYLSSNLEFSGDTALAARYQETVGTGGLEDASTLAKKIVPSAVVTKGGEFIGLVGATTQILETISSTGGVEVKGFPGDGGETNNMALLASQLQPVINDLKSQGVNKIILMAHLQQIQFEQELAPLLTDVDIILAAGSNTRLGDADDVAAAFPGHSADFANTYPIVTAGLDGKPTLIVNTDNEFTYLGRLVVEFDDNGEIIVGNLSHNVPLNGAYAATEANVASAWGVDVVDLPTTAFGPGTKGAGVKQITDAVQGVINVKDGDVKGFTSVYLEGERSFVRNQETNLGNLTADANLGALLAVPGVSSAPVVAVKNGGGIRTAIGAIEVASGNKIPPLANPSVGKPSGGISLLDIENSLRFNNGLMVFETTPAGLKAILEHGVFLLPNQGRFPQIGGVSFSFDPSLPAGSRIRGVALQDLNGNPTHVLYTNGVLVPGTPSTIQVVTSNFLAQGGDGYPMKVNGQNFRYLRLTGSTYALSAPIDESLDFTNAGVVPADNLGEQKVLSDFLGTNYSTPATAFAEAETSQIRDNRIQNLAFRGNGIIDLTDADGDGLSALEEIRFGTSDSDAPRIGETLTMNFSSLVSPGNTLRIVGRLPLGLTFNSVTNILSGTLRGAPGLFEFQVQELDASRRPVRGTPINLNIEPFPVTLLGNYEALLEVGSTNPQPTGILRITVTQGVWTASLDGTGTTRRSARGTFVVPGSGLNTPIQVVFPAQGLAPRFEITVGINGNSSLVDGTFNMNTGAVVGSLRGFRIAKGNALPPLAKRMNFALDQGVQDGINFPAGIGTGTGMSSTNGFVRFMGVLGDARTFSVSPQLSETGQIIVWIQPYTNRNSYLGGVITLPDLGQTLRTTQTLREGLQWFKAANAREKSYPAGFANPLPIDPLVAFFNRPANATALATELGLTALTFQSVIEGAGLSSSTPGATPVLPDQLVLTDLFRLNAVAQPGLVGWTGNIDRTSGGIAGILTLPPVPPGTAPSRASVRGVILPGFTSSGLGLVQVPIPGPTGSFRTSSIELLP